MRSIHEVLKSRERRQRDGRIDARRQTGNNCRTYQQAQGRYIDRRGSLPAWTQDLHTSLGDKREAVDGVQDSFQK